MLRHLIAVVVAIVAALLAIVAYYFIWIVRFGWEHQRLIASLLVFSICVYLFRRSRDLPTLLLLIGSVGLAVAHLHDFFISFGITHEIFQFGGSDSYVLQGFFEPRENPLIAIPADILRYTGFLVIVGIAWLPARFTLRHLTNRSSQPLAVAKSTF